MSAAIEGLVQKFETRQISRRELVTSLTALLTGVAGAASAAGVQSASGPVAQARTLNHVSLAVTDVEKAAAFYSELLGLKVVSRPGNGGINLGLGTSFFGLYKLANPGMVE